MNLTQLYKMGLAVLFGFTLTLSTVGCNSEPAAPPADNGGAEAGGGEEAGGEEAGGEEAGGEEAGTDGSEAP